LSVSVIGFESMCGIPLCLVPRAAPAFFAIADADLEEARGEFIRADACRTCDLSGKCFGVRRGYAELHGTGELRAVRAAERGAH
jgi:hypothetical protein